MTYIDFTQDLSVNVNFIDAEHKVLIAIINDLYSSMMIGESSSVLNLVFRDLIKYANIHFKNEEEMMEKKNYPDKIKHKEEHALFVEKITTMKNKFGDGNNLVSIKTLAYLKDWLTNHIMKTDKVFGEFLNKGE